MVSQCELSPPSRPTPLPTGGPGRQLPKAVTPPPSAEPTPPTAMARGGSRASRGMEGGGCAALRSSRTRAQAYLPQGSLSGSSVLQAHVQPPQLQPHGGHVEGVQRVMLAGRGEQTTGPLVTGRRAAHRPAPSAWLLSGDATPHGGHAPPTPQVWPEPVDGQPQGITWRHFIECSLCVSEKLHKNCRRNPTQQ